MSTLKRTLTAVAIVAAATSPALAGTKYATNLVSSSVSSPPPNPTLSSKSSIKMSDKGQVQIALADVTTSGGALASSSTVYNDSVKAGGQPGSTLDGSEYTVIIRAYMPGVAGLAPLIEVPIPVDLSGGKGKTKLALGTLFSLLGPGIGRSFEVVGVEVWGPLGAPNAADCQAVVAGPIPVGLPLPPGTCRGGTQIGISGLSIPQ